MNGGMFGMFRNRLQGQCMKIRPAEHRDFPTIARIQAASWKDTYRRILPDDYLQNRVSADMVRHWNEIEVLPDDVVLVAEDEETIGFIAVWCRPAPFIDNLHILPEVRSQGIGSQLMVAAADELLERGHTNVYLWVMAENLRAIRFYERLGGVRVEKTVKKLFGNEVPNLKVLWQDLSVIKAASRGLPTNGG